MISDVLSDACHQIGSYRSHEGTQACYVDHARALDGLVAIMDNARKFLDSPYPLARNLLSAELLRQVADALDNEELPMPKADLF
jgi:predicted nucleic acid-binding Zn ribbon protein